MSLVGDELTWVVDSDVSFHLTPNRKCFSSYRVGDLKSIKVESEGACQIEDIGDVYLTTSTGCILVLRDVGHVLEV